MISRKNGTVGLLILGGTCLGFAIAGFTLGLIAYGIIYTGLSLVSLVGALKSPSFKRWDKPLADNHPIDEGEAQ